MNRTDALKFQFPNAAKVTKSALSGFLTESDNIRA